MKILFACDLDNTLLYSYKHKRDGDICVETIKDKEQGFMSQKSCELLCNVVNNVLFVPVTTRSIEQYNRIHWLTNTTPQYAVSTNGAILLNNLERDCEWNKQSELFSKPAYSELQRLQKLLIEQDRFIRCRIVDEMYLFAYCKDGIDIKKCVSEYRTITKLDVISSGKKIYFFPPEINKGTAVIRLKQKFEPQLVICAGDSTIDIPMLNMADIAIVPSSYLAEQITTKEVYICNTHNFSEYVLSTILDIIKQNQGV